MLDRALTENKTALALGLIQVLSARSDKLAAGVGGETAPGGHQVRVDVLVGPALAEEVADRAARGLWPLAEDDLRDQGLTAPR